ARPSSNDVRARQPVSRSTDKMERLTGWRARTSFEEGLARTIAWYRENEVWWRGTLQSESRASVSSSSGPGRPSWACQRRRAIAARIAQRLGLPHPISPETAALSTSKLRQRERFAEAGVAQPAYEICSGAEEATGAAERIGFPCVIKAPDRQGQRGLTLVRTAEDVAEAVRVALDASRTATLLAEAHVPGLEVTVNAFSSGGHFNPLTVTDRLT